VFTSQLVYKEAPGTVFTYMSGTRFKVPGRVEFIAERGLLVHIRSGVHADPGADLAMRLKPANHVQPEMLAKLEDGYMPDAPRPRLAGLVPDAGVAAVAVADATPPPTVTANDAEPPPGRHRAHAGKRTTRKGTLVASAEHEVRPAAPAPAPPAVETQAPQALSGVDAGTVQVAMAEPVAPVHASAPATVAVETETSGMPTGAKIGIVLGVMLVALVGLTLVLRKR
jgi:hypothetical protein